MNQATRPPSMELFDEQRSAVGDGELIVTLGTVRLVEVRETLAGAVVEESGEMFPGPGDRVIPVRAPGL